MKYKNTISILVVLIAILSLFTSICGVFTSSGSGSYEIQSLYGETIKIYGKGIYHNDSVSVASQGIAQDIVTMIIGLPLLIASLYYARKELLRGRLLLTGTLGYFLYTYISYTFLWMYNSLFLVYVMLMSMSFFAFTLSMMSFDAESLKDSFNKKTPVKFLGGFQIFIAIAIGLLWIGKIIPTLVNNSIPVGLEHYTTLVIQAMDLGFVVPLAVLSGILLIKRKPFGYLLTSVIIIKGITMLTSISAMIIGQGLAGVKMSLIEVAIFPIFNLVTIYCLILVLKNIDEKNKFIIK